MGIDRDVLSQDIKNALDGGSPKGDARNAAAYLMDRYSISSKVPANDDKTFKDQIGGDLYETLYAETGAGNREQCNKALEVLMSKYDITPKPPVVEDAKTSRERVHEEAKKGFSSDASPIRTPVDKRGFSGT